MSNDSGMKITELINNNELDKIINPKTYLSGDVGEHTMSDIIQELSKPGRDPRRVAKVMEFSSEIFSIDDLKEGMVLPGIVTNITDFGAFVDIGIKQDGLIHISQMSDKFISSPSEIVKLQQHVMVKVVGIDVKRSRIQLSLKL